MLCFPCLDSLKLMIRVQYHKGLCETHSGGAKVEIAMQATVDLDVASAFPQHRFSCCLYWRHAEPHLFIFITQLTGQVFFFTRFFPKVS